MCVCVCVSELYDIHDIKPQTQKKNRVVIKNKHSSPLMCFVRWCTHCLLHQLSFPHPSLPPIISLHPPCDLSLNSQPPPSAPVYTSSSSHPTPILSLSSLLSLLSSMSFISLVLIPAAPIRRLHKLRIWNRQRSSFKAKVEKSNKRQ